MIGSRIRALSRAPKMISRQIGIGLAAALVTGLALVAVPNQSASAAPAQGTSVQTGTQSATTTTAADKKAAKQRAAKKKRERGIKAWRRVKTRAGDPYSYGADGPHSFDCSGLTRWVYKKLGRKLPHSSSGQVNHTFKVKKARKGDLVFFYDDGGVYHVAIYAGRHKGRQWIWHAPRSGESVKKEPIWTSKHFIRRVK